MTIDDAIAVTEMTTDVATILSKILLKPNPFPQSFITEVTLSFASFGTFMDKI